MNLEDKLRSQVAYHLLFWCDDFSFKLGFLCREHFFFLILIWFSDSIEFLWKSSGLWERMKVDEGQWSPWWKWTVNHWSFYGEENSKWTHSKRWNPGVTLKLGEEANFWANQVKNVWGKESGKCCHTLDRGERRTVNCVWKFILPW